MLGIRSHPRQHARRGAALLVALTLLLLCMALLTGSAFAARSASRATRVSNTITVADAEASAVMARYVMAWGNAEAGLAVGGEMLTPGTPHVAGLGALPITSIVRVVRLSPTRYILALECQVGLAGSELAVRRMSVVLQRVVPADSTAPPVAPAPLSRWALSDLY